MLMNYCENLKLKNGNFICIINGLELKCQCKEQIKLHEEKWKKIKD